MTTLQSAALSYLAFSRVNHSPGTTTRIKYVLDRFLQFAGRDTALTQITPSTIESFKEKRITEIRVSSLNIEIRHLKAFFRWLLRMSISTANPASEIKQIRDREERKGALNRDEIRRLLAHIPKGTKRELIRLALLTAMRRGELCQLRISDIDWKNSELVVRASHAKSGKSRRVPLSGAAVSILRRLARGEKSEFVFTYPSKRYLNRRITERQASQIVTDARKAAGLPGWIHFHSLRHTAITLMLESGADVVSVRDIAGHSSIAVTDRYSHSGSEQRHRAVGMVRV